MKYHVKINKINEKSKMKNQYFKEILIAKSLAYKLSRYDNLSSNPRKVADGVIDRSNLPEKNVQAKISEKLFNRLGDASDDLKLSKQAFIELAISNALDEFDAVAKEYDIYYDPRDPEDKKFIYGGDM